MRWIVRLVLAVLVLAALMVGALFLLPAGKVAGLVQDKVRAATGREVTLSGRLRPSLWPNVGVATGPVTLSNAAWSDEGPMLAAEGVSVGLDLRALLGGDIVVRDLTVQAPRIVLERAADGRTNWVFEGKAAPSGAVPQGGPEAGPRGTAPAVTLDRGEIADGTVLYVDHATGARTELDGLDVRLALPAIDGPADIVLSGRVNGQAVDLAARVAHVGDFAGGAVSGIGLEASLGAARLVFDGRAGIDPVAAEGAIEADLSDLDALFAALGRPVPDLPAGVGRRLGLEGQVTYAPGGSLHLRDATLRQDANVISGAADLTLAGKPRLTGRFSAGALDLSPFTAGEAHGTGGGAGGGSGGADDGWSTEPIDVGALGALDAEVAVSADSVDLGTALLGSTRILATLTDRRLVVELEEVRAYDGRVTGNFVINGRGGLSVGGDLTVAGMAMQGLLSDLADYDRLLGRADLRLEFLGSGNSMAAIMDGLSGGGSVAFGQGELRGLDLVGMLRTLDTSYMGEGAKTIFDAISASFTIENGVLRNDDLFFLAPLLTAAGKGKVGLGRRTLDYRVVPVALPGADGEGALKVPLLITGTWVDPEYRIDLEALARERLELDAQKQALEEKARESVARELGVDTEEGESLEDAARRKLEEEAKKGLRRLFGGD
ncbi:AsmA protein [Rhodovulum sp. ES.010]|uniref:AsmA family protein n=1 Tax=Rhodovulum sp. ES.010 TaxID=1882821 RepID=UPI00092837E0|nr:AsmA family protein [Rhodovulum sp. ES.010]SIO34070.1 AsmA protein [Rhodovulum sp. ES.010]